MSCWRDFNFVSLLIFSCCCWKGKFPCWFQPEQWILSLNKTWMPQYFLCNFCTWTAHEPHSLNNYLHLMLNGLPKHIKWYWNLCLLSSSAIFSGLSAGPASLVKWLSRRHTWKPSGFQNAALLSPHFSIASEILSTVHSFFNPQVFIEVLQGFHHRTRWKLI